MNSPSLDFLAQSQNDDGGWGYHPGQSSTVEASAAALLALRALEPGAEPSRRALRWLVAAQNRDGGWGFSREDDDSGWPTAWAMVALAEAEGNERAVARGAAWLLAEKRAGPSEGDDIERLKETLAIDPTVLGWPWLPGEAPWVEPTALSLLALRAVPRTAAMQARLDEGIRYLLDRRCHDGGWNIGNPVMFTQALPPRAHPTAWVLLALAQFAPATILPEDLAALRADMLEDGGVLALAWGLLALRTLGENDAAAADRLASLRGPGGSWNNNAYHTAMALLAEQGRFAKGGSEG